MASFVSKLPPATPSKLRGRLLGLFERHYAWNTEDCSEKPGGKYGYKRRRQLQINAILTLAILLSVTCLPFYLYSMHHLPPARGQHHQQRATAPPEKIRRVVSTATRELPAYRQTPNFFPEEDFRRLQAALRRHPALEVFEPRPPGEVGTKGLHMTFNTNGLWHLASDPELEPLFKFFKAVRYIDANAWKLNLFVMDTTEGFVDDEGVFGVHHDTFETRNGLNEWKPNEELEILSHITSVVYISIPEGMRGGNLYLWPPRQNIEHTFYEDVMPAHVLHPKENTLTEFRGDSFHGVSGFVSRDPREPRISLVLEQFRVPTSMYNASWEWRKGTYKSKFPLTTIHSSPSYYVLKEAQRRHALGLLHGSHP